VLIVEPGTPAEVVKILGFGVLSARGPEPEPPRSGVFAIPFYVSPEQAACQPFDGRADVYALGIMMYEMITGAPPFVDGDFASVLCQHLDDEAALASSRLSSPGALAKALDAIVQRCLQKDPARRYASAADLAEDLNRLEAAASRSKRRPMRAVERPTATIHSPAKSSGSASSPGAKVIVEAGPSDVPKVDATPPGGDVRASAPAVARVEPPVRSSPPRISVDQATIKISAVDLRLAAQLRPGNARTLAKRANLARVASSLLIRLRTGLSLVAAWCRRLLAAAKRHG
jgi:serine/threonine protein kinase